MSDAIITTIKSKVLTAVSLAKKAHEIILSDQPNYPVAIDHIVAANSYALCAESVYMSHYEQLGRDELNEFFFEFETFALEALENYRTNHSHQWTDIHFDRMKEKYETIKTVLGIF